MKDFDTHLKDMINAYGRMDSCTPSSFFLVSDDKEVPIFSKTLDVCHARMCYAKKGTYDTLVTAVPHRDKAAIAYLKMLITGPFKSMADLISLATHEGEYYLRCDRLGLWPANVLYNFCIATRVPIEFRKQLDAWYGNVQEGAHPILAFLLQFFPFTNGRRHTTVYANHLWFDSDCDWLNIINGTWQSSALDYKSEPAAVRPCNSIWYGRERHAHAFKTTPDEAVMDALGIIPAKPPSPPQKKVVLEGGGFQPAVMADNNFVPLAPGAWVVQGAVAAQVGPAIQWQVYAGEIMADMGQIAVPVDEPADEEDEDYDFEWDMEPEDDDDDFL